VTVALATPAPKVEVLPARPEPQPAPPKAEAMAAPKAAPKALTPTQKAVRREALAARATRAQAPDAEAAAEKAQRATPIAAAGIVQLAILPWGEVFVDGKRRGVSPPLRLIEVPPGPHTIEVRNTSFPSHAQRVEVRAGEPVRIRHHFR
jgi:hypothetical protein